MRKILEKMENSTKNIRKIVDKLIYPDDEIEKLIKNNEKIIFLRYIRDINYYISRTDLKTKSELDIKLKLLEKRKYLFNN